MHEIGQEINEHTNPAYKGVVVEALDRDSELPEGERPDASFSGYERDYMFMNKGDGTFTDIASGVGLDSVLDGRHVCSADFDNDGDQDMVVVNLQNPRLVYYENVAPRNGAWLRVKLHGKAGNPDGVGALVVVQTKFGKQAQQVTAGDSYMVQHPSVLHFGLGDTDEAQHIEVLWPSGKKQLIEPAHANHTIEITEE